MSKSNSSYHSDSDILRLVVETVFVPPRLPQEDSGEPTERRVNVALCHSLVEATRDFLQVISSSERPLWMNMIKMMELTCRATEGPFAEAELQEIFSSMAIGGMSI
jgi:hypothetical protein